jgi:hypothetical protein
MPRDFIPENTSLIMKQLGLKMFLVKTVDCGEGFICIV